jgi:hypothetical protein
MSAGLMRCFGVWFPKRGLWVAALFALTSWGIPAWAQAVSVSELAQRLRTSSDFRVRTQAALALGASGNAEAVGALCEGLGDANTTVRAASAAALGRLAAGGRECLSSRLAREDSAEVKSVIERALTRLQPKPTLSSETKYYISIGDVTNKTQRDTTALSQQVRQVLVKQLEALPGFVVAPPGETESQAKAILAKFPKVKGIFLWPKLQTRAAGSDLRLDFELSLFSYPNKDFRGSMSRNLTMPDTKPGDVASEDELISAAAENLVPELARAAVRI